MTGPVLLADNSAGLRSSIFGSFGEAWEPGVPGEEAVHRLPKVLRVAVRRRARDHLHVVFGAEQLVDLPEVLERRQRATMVKEALRLAQQ